MLAYLLLAFEKEGGHGAKSRATAGRLASPVPVQVKNTLWSWHGAAAQPAEIS